MNSESCPRSSPAESSMQYHLIEFVYIRELRKSLIV